MASTPAPAAAASLPPGAMHDAQPQAELPHVVIFPFMANGHTVPLTHLAHLLRRRRLATVTFLTTPGNAAPVRAALPGSDDGVAVVELPFATGHATTIPGVPPGAERAEDLDSQSSFPAFVEAVALLRPRFEEALAALRPRPGALVADALLYWAHAAAAGLGVRTLAFFGINMFAHVVREVLVRDNPAALLVGDGDGGSGSNAVFTVPELSPRVQLSLADIPAPFNDPSLTGPLAPLREMHAKLGRAIAESDGLIVNTFDAMEGHYVEHWNRHIGPKAWPVGPLCLAPAAAPTPWHGGAGAPPAWTRWLDDKAAAGRRVLYVALGTFMAVPGTQLKEVADGLERSGLDFLWAVRPAEADLGQGFEERVHGRGMVVREWVDQCAVLLHGCVKGFVSHGGWNSVLESIAAGVPLAVWPMGAEQPLNAKLVVEELEIGIRVKVNGTAGGVVGSEEIARVAGELMAGEKGVEAARNMVALAAKAREAVAEGGSSWRAVEELIRGLGQPGGIARKIEDGSA